MEDHVKHILYSLRSGCSKKKESVRVCVTKYYASQHLHVMFNYRCSVYNVVSLQVMSMMSDSVALVRDFFSVYCHYRSVLHKHNEIENTLSVAMTLVIPRTVNLRN